MPIYYIADNPTDPSHKLEGDVQLTFHDNDDAGNPVKRTELINQYSYGHGYVVQTYEYNGRDDSDFYAILFDPTTKTESRVQYASTRYPSTGYGATVDASDNVVQAWCLYRQEIAQKSREAKEAAAAAERLVESQKMAEAGTSQVAINAFIERSKLWEQSIREDCVKLLKTKNFRSDFRRSLRDQLVSWLEDPAPKYQSPFSPRQLEYIGR